jgi:cytoskeletal protein CcmA (bactofilin family)
MFKSNQIHLFLALALALVIGFGAVGTVQAFEYIEDSDLPAGETVDDDLFIAGDIITIDGTVNGDLFAFGQTVTINGTVNGSLVTTGQTIILNGEVKGSVYGGASAMTIGESAVIHRNLYYGGFSLEIVEGASVARDMAFGGYQAFLNGEIGRNLYAGAGALEINGTVGGDVRVDIGSPQDGPMPFEYFMPAGAPKAVQPGLRISEDAEISGKIAYTSTSDQAGSIDAEPAGGIVFSTPQPDDIQVEATPEFGDDFGQVNYGLQIGRWLLARARELVTLLALGALILWQLPELFKKVIDKATSEPLPSAGWGLVTVVGGYVGAAILGGLVLALGIFFGVLTLGGLGRSIFGVGFSSIGLAMAVFVLLVTYGSKLVLAFWSGQWLLDKISPQAGESKAWSLVLGVVIYVFLRAIPILGWLIGVLVTLVGMGAMWLVFQDWRKPALVEAEA